MLIFFENKINGSSRLSLTFPQAKAGAFALASGRFRRLGKGVEIAPAEGTVSRRKSAERRAQSVECLVKIRVVFVQTVDLLDRVHHRGVMLVVEQSSDLREGELRELAAEIHRDLARERDGLGVRLGLQVRNTDAVVGSDGLQDL